MAAFWSFMQHPRFCFLSCLSGVLLFLLLSQAFRPRQQLEKHKRDFSDSTEIPAEHIDPAAIDLTLLVNTLINSSQSGSRQLFSLLSVTSYSSLALHKLTLLVYNISSTRNLESGMFRRRFCYCVTNETNDLTDFTAILLDVMGNSTSHLHELFKSSSILSVSQRNNSDCIYICVMAGKTGRVMPDLWEVGSITPLFNQTIAEGPHTVANISDFRLPAEWSQQPTNLSHISPSGTSSMLTGRIHSTAHASAATPDETPATTAKVTSTLPTLPPSTSFSPSTVRRPETSKSWTTQRFLALSRTTRSVTTRPGTLTMATVPQTQTTEITSLPLLRTLKQPTTTVSAPATVRPLTTAIMTQLTTLSLKSTTHSPAISLAPLTTATSTTQHTLLTVHPTRLSPFQPTAGTTVARRTTLSRRTTTPSKSVETEKPEVVPGGDRRFMASPSPSPRRRSALTSCSPASLSSASSSPSASADPSATKPA
ncbi:uncharacterized protein LOC121644490 isoform X2 [Melanotaenia boesemani]|uniref:uncharacterized protein LOC121644490 isoform X2 n=1 Tax=Melanotaenia boesemani TaxID=1250792 RepID=UPI001C03F21A|nr:uncharacterized protein LOC121644490 isoform X2 [Melanotaenia boesemani]